MPQISYTRCRTSRAGICNPVVEGNRRTPFIANPPDANKATELAGKHFVVAELCRRGCAAALTDDHYPDIVFRSREGEGKDVTIRVQTIREENGLDFFLSSAAAGHPGLSVFVVLRRRPPHFDVYILPGPLARDIAQRARKRWLDQHPNDDPVRTPLILNVSAILDNHEKWDLLCPLDRSQ